MKRLKSEADKIITGLMEIGELLTGERAHALVVEDDPNDAEYMQRALRGIAEVSVVTSGEEAINMINERLPSYFHVLFVDLNLPGISGLDVVRYVRRVTPISGVILVTGSPPTSDQMSSALEGGMVMVVKKPLEKTDVRKILRGYC